MAKDGTVRGGKRINQTGRPRKSNLEKLENGNPSGRKLTVIDVDSNLDPVDIEGVDMPPVKEYLSSQQRDGSVFGASEIYKEVWLWLKKVKCEKIVATHLIEQFAVTQARWIQCEEMISRLGMIAKHPTTGAPIQSPYVAMSQSFMKQTTLAWMQIFQVVKENSTVDYRGPNPQDDMMERLLTARKM